MFKNIMAVDIGSSSTKIMIGNSRKVKLAGMFKTPEGSVEDGNILMPDDYAKAFQKFIDENSITEKSVSIALNSSDALIRHIEVPIIETKSLRKSVEWEINQYLPENGQNHYMDFEIIDKINTHDKKVYKILVAAVPKTKVDSLMELFESIGLEVDSIDIEANCIARVFKSCSREESGKSVGVIDVGFNTSNLIILDDGKLFMEKQVNIGIDDMIMNISKLTDCDSGTAYGKLFESFNFENHDDIKDIIVPQFERIYDNFEQLIQFYTTGKSKKNLDKIYLIGGGGGIKGIEKYTSDYFASQVTLIDSPSKIPIKAKFPDNCDIRIYINNFGLLLRKE